EPVDHFLLQGEEAISGFFNTVADQIAGQSATQAAGSGGVPLTGLQGAGATTHSAFSVQPQGGGAAASTNPQCTWGMQKFQSGLGAGGGAQLSARATRLGSPIDTVGAALMNFFDDLTTNPVLTAQWAKLQSGASGLGNASSPSDFVRQAAAEILR